MDYDDAVKKLGYEFAQATGVDRDEIIFRIVAVLTPIVIQGVAGLSKSLDQQQLVEVKWLFDTVLGAMYIEFLAERKNDPIARGIFFKELDAHLEQFFADGPRLH